MAMSQDGKNASGQPPNAKSGTATCIYPKAVVTSMPYNAIKVLT